MPLRIGDQSSDRTVSYLIEIGARQGEISVAHRAIALLLMIGGGKPFSFIDFQDGAGSAINNEAEFARGGAERPRTNGWSRPTFWRSRASASFSDLRRRAQSVA